MTKSFLKYLPVIVGLMLINSCKKESKPSVRVFAAVSLSEVLKDIEKDFEKVHDVDLQINFASSGTLARQISQGAVTDVYISANKRWTKYLDSVKKGTKTTKTIATNSLVFITPKSSDLVLADISNKEKLIATLKDGKLSIGDPSHVPAGMYAKEALDYFGWFEDLQSNLLLTKDVRSALKYVELEEALLGIVYKTDALASQKVKVVSDISNLTHRAIKYEAVNYQQNRKEVNLFFNYLSSLESEAIWKKHGFKR